ncbi:hypothetical protein DACRYDRAFT_54044 [Dacryopinax primogenitus]|uniref:Fe2OG dioxygenase domain-containing protein n=1 Tax=Dacryopinax primogenitus (strain DJM 731) TaxID=1858805 RepID=M5FXH5_DACPD|nr:uncharacterized protein DACRYDRAFT_54044 [Dacryopinax primogenitus]EJU00495.1 hypothetical protein DACRYDRAFT_54044 [Dacryopinax primogenitus]
MKPSLPACDFALSFRGPTFTIVPPRFSLTVHSPLIHRPIVDKDLDMTLYRPFVHSTRQLYDYLLESLPWYRVQYTVRGMSVKTPRYTSVYGKDITNSRDKLYQKQPRPIPPLLAALKNEVEKVSGSSFNFVLCNFYADGKDSISYHSDDESFLGPEPSIASMTLGATRSFYMRPKTDKSVPVLKTDLRDSDLLIMRGKTQHCWEHSVPKRANAAPRINLTFRKAMNVKGTNNYYRYNVGDGPVFRYIHGRMVQIMSDNSKTNEPAVLI